MALNTNHAAGIVERVADADERVFKARLQPGRVTITGLADSEPVADNGTAAGRAQNRRIEVIVDG